MVKSADRVQRVVTNGFETISFTILKLGMGDNDWAIGEQIFFRLSFFSGEYMFLFALKIVSKFGLFECEFEVAFAECFVAHDGKVVRKEIEKFCIGSSCDSEWIEGGKGGAMLGPLRGRYNKFDIRGEEHMRAHLQSFVDFNFTVKTSSAGAEDADRKSTSSAGAEDSDSKSTSPAGAEDSDSKSTSSAGAEDDDSKSTTDVKVIFNKTEPH